MKRILIAGGLALLCAFARKGDPAPEMAAAAKAFLDGLGPDLAPGATFKFADAERLNWHFVPRARKGVPFKSMNAGQQTLALALLSTGLSVRGRESALAIMSLDQILRELEAGKGKNVRDPQLYYFSIFGKPEAGSDWGWRLEGHHVSINFTLAGGRAIASAPLFLGANPAETKGIRVLGEDEDRGRALMKSLNADQRAKALFSTAAPKEVILVPGEKPRSLDPAGIGWSGLDGAQRDALWMLIREYAERFRAELADQELGRIDREKGSFAWAGGLDRGEPHYFRVQGPTFVLEYDNVQNNANHAHSVWHDPAGDFGADLLRLHHEAGHGK